MNDELSREDRIYVMETFLSRHKSLRETAEYIVNLNECVDGLRKNHDAFTKEYRTLYAKDIGTKESIQKWLAEQIEGVVDLRYSNGEWSVMVEQGDGWPMVRVPGTMGDDPLTSLDAARKRWNNRSAEKPF